MTLVKTRLARPMLTRTAFAAFYAVAMALIACTAAVQTARADEAAAAVEAGPVASGGFVKKSFNINGAWEIATLEDGRRVLRFDEDFRTRGGPDLKVFLSPASIEDVDGDTAVNGSILLGELVNRRGAQEYEIPADVDLSAFQSVLVHCEEFAKLWGGGAL